jgi:hypothetical protein
MGISFSGRRIGGLVKDSSQFAVRLPGAKL